MSTFNYARKTVPEVLETQSRVERIPWNNCSRWKEPRKKQQNKLERESYEKKKQKVQLGKKYQHFSSETPGSDVDIFTGESNLTDISESKNSGE